MSLFDDEEMQLTREIAAKSSDPEQKRVVIDLWSQAFKVIEDDNEKLFNDLLIKAREALDSVELFAEVNNMEFNFNGSKRSINDKGVRVLNDSSFFTKKKRKADSGSGNT